MSSVQFNVSKHIQYYIVIGTLVTIDYRSMASRPPNLNTNDLERSGKGSCSVELLF